MPTSVYSSNTHMEGISSVPGTVLGRGHTQPESEPLPALFKSTSGERDVCTYQCQMLFTDVSSCSGRQATQAGLGTEPGRPCTRPRADRSQHSSLPWGLSPVPSFFTTLLSLLLVLCLSIVFAFAWCRQSERPHKIRVTVQTAFPRSVLVYVCCEAVNRLCPRALFHFQRCASLEG